MKRTISGMVGRGSLTHNNRDFIAENIDRNRTADNITYINEDLKKVYDELFGEAQERYNANVLCHILRVRRVISLRPQKSAKNTHESGDYFA